MKEGRALGPTFTMHMLLTMAHIIVIMYVILYLENVLNIILFSLCQTMDSQRPTEFALNYLKLMSLHSSRKCRESVCLHPGRICASLALMRMLLFATYMHHW